MSVIDDIKDRIDIVDLVSETVKLRRTGKNYIGFCPFHSNTHTPAFVVFPESGTWRCFGACGEGGDAITYVMRRDGCDFQSAIETLARKAGIELKPLHTDQKAEKENERLYHLMEEVTDFFHNNLTQHPSGKIAINYLNMRGTSKETIEKFRMGYALNSWDALIQFLQAKQYTLQEMDAVGVISRQRDDKGEIIPNGRCYDRFRNRLIIPICDSKGRPIAFGARVLNPTDMPKYLNSPQTEMFDKGKTLFGFNFARPGIRERDQIVLVEGYMDVIALHQAGYTNTVCPMGTALTDHQAKQIARLTRNIILSLDADAAGEHAALRDIDIFREISRTSGENRSLNLRVTEIPDGMDPDEVVLRDPAEWQKILDNAKPIIIHIMETAAAGKDLNDARTKADIADKTMPLIREVTNPIERETYRQQLARFLSVDENLLTFAGTTPAQPGPSGKRPFPEKPKVVQKTSTHLIFQPRDSLYTKETEILRCLYHYYDSPGALAPVDRALRTFHLAPLTIADFDDSTMRQIADLYFRALDQDEDLDTRHYIEERITDSLRAPFEKIKKFIDPGDIELSEIHCEVARSVAYMRREKAEFTQSLLQDMNDDRDEDGNPEIQTLINTDSEALLQQRRNLDRLIESLSYSAARLQGNQEGNQWI